MELEAVFGFQATDNGLFLWGDIALFGLLFPFGGESLEATADCGRIPFCNKTFCNIILERNLR